MGRWNYCEIFRKSEHFDKKYSGYIVGREYDKKCLRQNLSL